MTVARSILESIGLNPKEIEIYMLLLQTGGSSASGLARRMKIPTSTAQYTCQQLLKKGLVRMIQKGNMYLFGAQSPKKLMELVDHQEEELRAKRDALEGIVGELEGIMSSTTVMPKVKFFEGREGLIDAYHEVLQDMDGRGEIVGFLNPLPLDVDALRIKNVLEKFVNDRVKQKISTRILTVDSPYSRGMQKKDKASLREMRLVPAKLHKFDAAEIMFYNDKMYAMTVERDQVFAVIIQNKSIVGLQKEFFELAWAQAKA